MSTSQMGQETEKPMPFPKTIDELVKAGYKHDGDAQCKGCGASIEWWVTPRNKKIPMDFGTANPHWMTCPNANDFRDRKVAS